MKRTLKNFAAFVVSLFVGLVAGSAMMTIDSIESIEEDVRKRITRHRSAGR